MKAAEAAHRCNICYILKGVIEIISYYQTWRFVYATEMVDNSTCIGLLYPAAPCMGGK